MNMKNNPLIRDVIICILCVIGMLALRHLGITRNIGAGNMYNLGIYVGVLACFFLDALSTFIMNIYFIIRFTRCTPKEFGEFLNSVGVTVKCEQNEDDTEND